MIQLFITIFLVLTPIIGLRAQNNLNLEGVLNISRTNCNCNGGNGCATPNALIVYDTVPQGKIWKLEAVTASGTGGRFPIVSVNGSNIAMYYNSNSSAVTYEGNSIWLKEGSVISGTSVNPGGGSGCFESYFFYSILEFSISTN